MMPPAKKAVLVVDDEANNIELARVILSKEGYALYFAENGAEALAVLQSEPIDILVLDLMLPDIPGLEVLKRLHASSSASRLRTIIVSALSDDETREKAAALHADRYLVKPYDIMTLKSLLREMASSVPMNDDEVEAFLDAAFQALLGRLDEETEKEIARAFFEQNPLPLSMTVQLAYLSRFLEHAGRMDSGDSCSVTRRLFTLKGDPVDDLLQDRINRIVIGWEAKVRGLDAEALFEKSEHFFLHKP